MRVACQIGLVASPQFYRSQVTSDTGTLYFLPRACFLARWHGMTPEKIEKRIQQGSGAALSPNWAENDVFQDATRPRLTSFRGCFTLLRLAFSMDEG